MIDNDKTLKAVDRLLDEVNQLRMERDEARKAAFDWRNANFVSSTITKDELKEHIRMNPFAWEVDQ
jgi:hypothetical protein